MSKAASSAARGLLLTAAALLFLAVATTASAQQGDAGCDGPLVVTSSGIVCGLEVPAYDGAAETVEAFLGIPFAETTAGENRWRPPAPSAPAATRPSSTPAGRSSTTAGAWLPPKTSSW